MISHLSLTKVETISPSISLQNDCNGFEFIIIEHEKLSAALTLHGAHLIHFQKKQEPAIIWLSKTAIFDSKKAIRGGVPVCWPWFGPADSHLGENLPAHGIARTSKWDLINTQESSDGVVIELQLKSTEASLKIWPHDFELTLVITLNNECKLALTTENKGNKPFTYGGALHTYLNISSPESVNITGLNQQFTNSLNNKCPEIGDTTLLIDKAIDSIYKKSNVDIHLKDAQFQRDLTICNTGNNAEVLWSPWIEGAEAFADMPDNGYQTMFCIESAITGLAGQQVANGEKHTLTTLIK